MDAFVICQQEYKRKWKEAIPKSNSNVYSFIWADFVIWFKPDNFSAPLVKLYHFCKNIQKKKQQSRIY